MFEGQFHSDEAEIEASSADRGLGPKDLEIDPKTPEADFRSAVQDSIDKQISSSSQEKGKKRFGRLGLAGLAFLALMSATPKAEAYDDVPSSGAEQEQVVNPELQQEVDSSMKAVKTPEVKFRGESTHTYPDGTMDKFQSNDPKEFERLEKEHERLEKEHEKVRQDKMLQDLHEKAKDDPKLQKLLDHFNEIQKKYK